MTDVPPPFPADLAARVSAYAMEWDAGAKVAITGNDSAQPAAGDDQILAMVDLVLRPNSSRAAAEGLTRLARQNSPLIAGWLSRVFLATAVAAPLIPLAAVPWVRRMLRTRLQRLVLDGSGKKFEWDLNLIQLQHGAISLHAVGPTVFGDEAAAVHRAQLARWAALPEVDEIVTTVRQSIGPQPVWALAEAVDGAVSALRPLWELCAGTNTRLVLEATTATEVDFTLDVFIGLMSLDPASANPRAGVSLPTAFFATYPALQRLRQWLLGREQAESGSEQVLVRLVGLRGAAQDQAQAQLSATAAHSYQSFSTAMAGHVRCLQLMLDPVLAQHLTVRSSGGGALGAAFAAELSATSGGLAAGGAASGSAREDAHEQPDAPERLESVEIEVALGDLPGGESIIDKIPGQTHPNVSLRTSVPVLLAGGEESLVHLLAERQEWPGKDLGLVEPADIVRLAAKPHHESHDGAAASSLESVDTPGSGYPVVTDNSQLTQAVLGFPELSDQDSAGFADTAIYGLRESHHSSSSFGITLEAAADPASAAQRALAQAVVSAGEAGAGAIDDAHAKPPITADWGALTAADRSAVLRRAADKLAQVRTELTALLVSEQHLRFVEADAQVIGVVDCARYYAAQAGELDALSGAVAVPDGQVRVEQLSPWLLDTLEPVLASLAVGSAVKLALRQQPNSAVLLAVEALSAAGVPGGAVTVVAPSSADVTGTADLAEGLVGDPAEEISKETDGGLGQGAFGSVIVTASADQDQAVADIVHSAFWRSGSDNTTTRVVFAVAPVGRVDRFSQQLTDAVRSLRVGVATDLAADVGPITNETQARKLLELTQTSVQQEWWVTPAMRDGEPAPGALWRPGVRVIPAHSFTLHLLAADYLVGGIPVLTVVAVPTLGQAIDLQNLARGTAGLYTRDPAELSRWLDNCQAPTLVVNRPTVGARIKRQPWPAQRVGLTGMVMNAGGPNRLVTLCNWRATAGSRSSTLHLRGLDHRISALIEQSQPELDFDSFERLRRAALADAVVWRDDYGAVHDQANLSVERNLLLYRPVPVEIRATSATDLSDVLRVVIAAVRARSQFVLSLSEGLPGAVRRMLGQLRAQVIIETDEQWLARRSGDNPEVGSAPEPEDSTAIPLATRVRIIGPERVALAGRLQEVADESLWIMAGEVTASGRIELLTFLREVIVSIAAVRAGMPDQWSTDVI